MTTEDGPRMKRLKGKRDLVETGWSADFKANRPFYPANLVGDNDKPEPSIWWMILLQFIFWGGLGILFGLWITSIL